MEVCIDVQEQDSDLASIVLVASLNIPWATAAGDAMSQAIALYNQRQYQSAASAFRNICQLQPANENAHYYLALCYQASGQRSAALVEYTWVTSNARNSLLRQQANVGATALGGSTSTATSRAQHGSASDAAPTANSYFICQLKDPKWNRNASSSNSNCGPTCLAMVFKRFGKYPSNFSSSDPQYLVEETRKLVTGGNDQNYKVTAGQLRDGALRAGYHARSIDTIDQIDSALQNREMVIAVGNPFRTGSYGHRVGYEPFDNGHFILVTGRAGGLYVVNDPFYLQGPINLGTGELDGFLSYYRGKYTGNCVAIAP